MASLVEEWSMKNWEVLLIYFDNDDRKRESKIQVWWYDDMVKLVYVSYVIIWSDGVNTSCEDI